MRLVKLALLILGSVVMADAAPAPPHRSLPPPIVPECMGVNLRTLDLRPRELEMIAAAGFRWVRFELNWAVTERTPGEYDFTAYDRLVDALERSKLKAVFVLGYGNPLYADPGDVSPFLSRAATFEFRSAFSAWATVAMRRYQGHGHLWEIWDEPNRLLSSTFGMQDYVSLVASTAEAWRSVDLLGARGEAFIGPSTATIDLPFLEECFRQHLLEYWDGVSLHPYRQERPESVEEEYRNVRLLLRKHAPLGKSIAVICGGWGYSAALPASAGKNSAGFDPQMQANLLARLMLTNVANDVALSIWSDWRDDPSRAQTPSGSFGLVEAEYQPARNPLWGAKPAFFAMRALAQQMVGLRFNKRLCSWNSDEDYMLLFAKNKEVRVAVWTVRKVPERIGLPVSEGERVIADVSGQLVVQMLQGESHDRFGMKFLPTDQVTYVSFPEPNEMLRMAASATRLPLELIAPNPGPPPQIKIGFKNYASQMVAARLTSESDRSQQKWILEGEEKDTKYVGTNVYSESRITARTAKQAPAGAALTLGIEIIPGGASVEDPLIPITQRVRLAPSNPLKVTRLPGKPGEVVIRIENPTGIPWQGKAVAVGAYVDRSGFGYGMGWGWGTKSAPPPPPNSRLAFGPPISEQIELIMPAATPMVEARIPLQPAEKQTWWQGIKAVALISPEGYRADVDVPDSRYFELDIPNIQVIPDGDSKVRVVSSHRPAEPPTGPLMADLASLRVNYDFAPGWKSLRVINPTWPPASEKNLIGSPREFGLWVFGDGKGLVAHMRFIDSTDQIFQTPGVKVDWVGWRHVTFPMTHQPGKRMENWGGRDDGHIHYPIDLDSVLVLDNVSREPVKGEIYATGPSLIY